MNGGLLSYININVNLIYTDKAIAVWSKEEEVLQHATALYMYTSLNATILLCVK